MHEKRPGQRRIFMLDEERSVRAYEARKTSQLGYRSAFRNQDAFGVSPIAVSARDAGLLRIQKTERVVDSNGEGSEFDGLLAPHRAGAASDDFGDLHGFQWPAGV